MAQRKSVAWSELKVGILVIVAFAALIVAVLQIGGTTRFFGKTMKITSYFPSASGLREGAEVWVDGLLVGNVTDIDLNRDPNAKGKVAVVMKIDANYRGLIRSDSAVGIGSIGLLGDKNIQIESGTDKGAIIEDGGSISGQGTGDIDRILKGTDTLLGNLKVLSDRAVEISDNISAGKGTLGKFLNDTDIHDNLNKATIELRDLIRDVRTGPGTAGKLINDDTLYMQLVETMNHVDSMLEKIDHGNGTAAKLLNDSTIMDRMESLLDRVDKIMTTVDKGEGSLGKFINDDGFYNDTRQTLKRVDSLVDSIQNGNGTMGLLIKDPSLFNSFSQTSSEMQKLMYDIRQNPKKYLTINFRFF
jgi:phospholipid/cholesterol/gamma-HCH transport system substrate-binding protein